MTIAVVVVLVLALVAAVVVIIRLVNARTELLRYRDGHPHTPADVTAARIDARKRSQNSVSGNVWEGLAPYLPDFPYNPRDCHHLGKPIDLLAFDGLSEGLEVWIRLVEIKTGKSRLNANERLVRDAVEAGRVTYEVQRLPGSPALDAETPKLVPSYQRGWEDAMLQEHPPEATIEELTFGPD